MLLGIISDDFGLCQLYRLGSAKQRNIFNMSQSENRDITKTIPHEIIKLTVSL